MKIASRAQMQKFAALMAKKVAAATPEKKARVFALVGDLGSGKTTFTQGFLKSLGVKHPVISPTFLLIRHYPLKKFRFTDAYHIDCYRLKKASEILKLDLKEILSNPKNIVLIEWPELVKKYLPKDTRWIQLRHGKGKNERIVLS